MWTTSRYILTVVLEVFVRALPVVLALVGALALQLSHVDACRAGDSRGVSVVPIRDAGGKEVGLYRESHALVIGASHYTNGWPSLPGVKQDVVAVQVALEAQGFSVELLADPTREKLESAFTDFINRNGLQPENRLLFYFAGHGHTIKQSYGEEMGYIVPVDAPNPNKDRKGFLVRALDMQSIEVYAKRIQAKHALFLVDSCFSGQIFALTRAVPESITYKTFQPVRQFITSGSAEEQLPDRSVFREQFEAALVGEADANQDGYVTGSELGEFLQEKVVNHSRNSQHPQYLKIRGPKPAEGDFVFQMAGGGSVTAETPETAGLAARSGKLVVETEPAGAAVQVRTESAIGAEFVWVPGGCFQMGSPGAEAGREADEGPQHEVCLDGFWMGKTEVTVGQFRAFVTENGYKTDAERDAGGQQGCYSLKEEGGKRSWMWVAGRSWRDPGFSQREDFPVACVSWNDVTEYVKWARGKTGKTVVLPTEAQWEYAARGGTTTARYWGEDPNQACGYANAADQTQDGTFSWNAPRHECSDGYYYVAPAGSFKANGYGLQDMLGNVWEWCSDWYGEKYYSESQRNNPTGPSSGSGRVGRGGGWYYEPRYVRAADRSGITPGRRFVSLGFRLVLPPGQQ